MSMTDAEAELAISPVLWDQGERLDIVGGTSSAPGTGITGQAGGGANESLGQNDASLEARNKDRAKVIRHLLQR